MRKLYVMLVVSLVFVAPTAFAHDTGKPHDHEDSCAQSAQDVTDGDLDKMIEDIEKREPVSSVQATEVKKDSEILVCDY